VIEARRRRLTQAQKDTIKGSGTPTRWTPERRVQIDRDGCWCIKRGMKRQPAPGDDHKRELDIAVAVLGKPHRHRPRARFSAPLQHHPRPGGQLGAALDRDITGSDAWADTAYRSAVNLALVHRRGLKPQFQRKKPWG
jgi:IS5 family transposase